MRPFRWRWRDNSLENPPLINSLSWFIYRVVKIPFIYSFIFLWLFNEVRTLDVSLFDSSFRIISLQILFNGEFLTHFKFKVCPKFKINQPKVTNCHLFGDFCRVILNYWQILNLKLCKIFIVKFTPPFNLKFNVAIFGANVISPKQLTMFCRQIRIKRSYSIPGAKQ